MGWHLQVKARPLCTLSSAEGARDNVDGGDLVHLNPCAASLACVVVESAARVHNLFAIVLPHAAAIKGRVEPEIICVHVTWAASLQK